MEAGYFGNRPRRPQERHVFGGEEAPRARRGGHHGLRRASEASQPVYNGLCTPPSVQGDRLGQVSGARSGVIGVAERPGSELVRQRGVSDELAVEGEARRLLKVAKRHLGAPGAGRERPIDEVQPVLVIVRRCGHPRQQGFA